MSLEFEEFKDELAEAIKQMKQNASEESKGIANELLSRPDAVHYLYHQIRHYFTTVSSTQAILLDFGDQKMSPELILGIGVEQDENGGIAEVKVLENLPSKAGIDVGVVPLYDGLNYIYVEYNYDALREELQHSGLDDDDEGADQD